METGSKVYGWSFEIIIVLRTYTLSKKVIVVQTYTLSKKVINLFILFIKINESL